MNAQTKVAAAPTGLALLREPFPDNQISKLPKPTKAQTDAVKADYKKGIRCKLCGAWHHPEVVHLDYVGHAALTDRLLDADPEWSWEPASLNELGLPAFDQSGGLWIKLTVCGVTRLGYGHAAGKPNQDPGAREKEVIGDALRNAAMRFGAALDLWHKGQLHADESDEAAPAKDDGNKAGAKVVHNTARDAPFPQGPAANKTSLKALGRDLWRDVLACGDLDTLETLLATNQALIAQLKEGMSSWWDGGVDQSGMSFEGLGQIIDRMKRDFENGVN